MGKTVQFSMVFVALVCMANCAFAQGIGPGFDRAPVVQPSSSFLSVPSFFPTGLPESISLGGIEFRPAVRVGYQSIGLNFSLPAFSQIDNLPAPLDLSMKNANMWIGAVGLDVNLGRDWFLYASGEGNAKRNVTVYTNDEPTHYYGLTAFVPYEWTGTQLEWWSIDTGIGYRVSWGSAVLLGFRWDRLSLVPGDPRDRAGNPVNIDAPCATCPPVPLPPGVSTSDRAYSDIWAKTWIPYIGIQVDARDFRGSVLWGPFANGAVRVPLRFTRGIFVPIDPNFPRYTAVEYGFRLRNPAGFLEGNFDYETTVAGALRLGLWLKGTWLVMKGTGEMTQDFHTVDQRGIFPPLYEDQEALAKYGRYIMAGGLSAYLTF